jgi:hypothetical protein
MARYEEGWVKLWRSTLDSDLEKHDTLWWLWTWFLRTATWKESKVLWEGEQRMLPPGSVVYGITELARKRKQSKSTISRWIKYLVDSGRLRNETGTRGCIATICNWKDYQVDDELNGTTSEQKRNSDGTRTEPYEEGKKERRKNIAESGGIRTAYSEKFENAWEAYGKVGKKADASKAFEELNLSSEELQSLLRAIPTYIANCRRNDRKQMYFGTFLREDWKDWDRSTSKANIQDDLSGFDFIRKQNEEALARLQKASGQ